jgi:hypothetical protein
VAVVLYIYGVAAGREQARSALKREKDIGDCLQDTPLAASGQAVSTLDSLSDKHPCSLGPTD